MSAASLGLILALCAQPSWAAPARRARRGKPAADATRVYIDSRAEWPGWLGEYFPLKTPLDKGQRAALDALRKDWERVTPGAGFFADGAPGAVGARYEKGSGNVAALAVFRWQDGRWKRVLLADGGGVSDGAGKAIDPGPQGIVYYEVLMTRVGGPGLGFDLTPGTARMLWTDDPPRVWYDPALGAYAIPEDE